MENEIMENVEVTELEPVSGGINTKGLLIAGGVTAGVIATIVLAKKVVIPAVKRFLAKKAAEAEAEQYVTVEDDSE